MKRLALVMLGVVLAFANGCEKSGGGAANPTSGPAGKLRVALLHPGRETDGGWNQLAYQALVKLHETTGVEVRHTFSPSSATFKSDMRDYAQQGYTLVICHGSEYVKAAREVAAAFPTTKFVVTGSADAGEGVATVDFRLWEATYLCGLLGAKLVPAGPAGLIGGQDFTTVRNTMNAFANGAKSVASGYVSYSQFVGSWDDVAAAQQTARSLIETRGVKVIFQNCDAAAQGIFQAAAGANVFAFGANSDQNAMSPGVVPASAVIDMEKAYELVLKAIEAGKFEAKAYVGDMKSGIIDVVLNPDFAQRWPRRALHDFEEAKAGIIAGKIDVLAGR